MTQNRVAIATLLLALTAGIRSVSADIIASDGGSLVARFSDSGQFIQFHLGAFDPWATESVGQLVLGGDGLVYSEVNNLGAAVISRFDPYTGVNPDGGPFSGIAKIPNYAASVGVSYGPSGDLFAFDRGYFGSTPRLLRINGTDGLLAGSLDIANPSDEPVGILAKELHVPNAAFDTELLVARPGGKIERYFSNRPPAGPAVIEYDETLNTGLASSYSLNLGPDGLLYLLQPDWSIARYSLTTESVVDTFVPAATPVSGSWHRTWFRSIQFAGNGDLLLLGLGFPDDMNPTSPPRYRSEIQRYDAQTGAFKGLVMSFEGQYYYDSFVSVAVPEPGSLTLLAAVSLGGVGLLRKRLR
ncbi:hypothetical protein [Lacipirellula sp.]|uniref:hypothetical protein n=1 Tax=Lacipirellula sp. TaxID=2691419 RepID=UPI003D133FF4